MARGFELSGRNSTGMGIRIMRYRARVIGATLDLKSRPGQGTQITCCFMPLRQKRGNECQTRKRSGSDGLQPRQRTKAHAQQTSPEKKRIFIVDDHAMFREGLRQLIDREAGLCRVRRRGGRGRGVGKHQPDRTRPRHHGHFIVRHFRH